MLDLKSVHACERDPNQYFVYIIATLRDFI